MKWPRVGLAALLAVFLLAASCSTGTGKVTQPIQFNHNKHVQELELECTTCHRYVREEQFAGRPKAEVCVECHEEALTESPEEQKLIEYINSGEEIPWRRLYKVADHVFYSHRRHVTVAGIDCSKCHGDIAHSTAPPERPLRKLKMSFCWDCHEENGASTDCDACHK